MPGPWIQSGEIDKSVARVDFVVEGDDVLKGWASFVVGCVSRFVAVGALEEKRVSYFTRDGPMLACAFGTGVML